MTSLFDKIKTIINLKAIRSVRRWFNLVFVLLIALLALLILFGDRNSVYGIKGNTQTLSLSTSPNQLNKWQFQTGEVFTFSDLSCALTLSDNSVLTLEEDVKITVTIQQDQIQNGFLLAVRSDDKSVATISNADKTCVIPSYLELFIAEDTLLTLPFEAHTFIGEDVGVGVDKLLLDGSVDILEKQFFSSKRYIGDTIELNMGDRVWLQEPIDKQAQYAKGFLRFVPESKVYFSVTSQAESVLVERFGSSTLTISPSIWSRLTNDPVVAALGSLIALLFLLLEFLMAFNQLFKNEEKSNEV